jgi:hypothetical protein
MNVIYLYPHFQQQQNKKNKKNVVRSSSVENRRIVPIERQSTRRARTATNGTSRARPVGRLALSSPRRRRRRRCESRYRNDSKRFVILFDICRCVGSKLYRCGSGARRVGWSHGSFGRALSNFPNGRFLSVTAMNCCLCRFWSRVSMLAFLSRLFVRPTFTKFGPNLQNRCKICGESLDTMSVRF